MHSFTYRQQHLHCEDIPVRTAAERFGTPLYLYSAETLRDHYRKLHAAFRDFDPLICYSVKANSNLAILNLLVREGAGLDIVSGGELFRAKKAGCPAEKIVYASVGKTEEEIRDALEYRIHMFNVESIPELRRINEIAGEAGKRAPAALRFNPDIQPDTHAYITTGKKETKFGMDIETVRHTLLNQGEFPHVDFRGIHVHIGSQITDALPFQRTLQKVLELTEHVQSKGIALSALNIGGGLGIVYENEQPQTADDFAQAVAPVLRKINLPLILEPGRFIAGNAGILLTKVLYVKDTPAKRFLVVDAGMNDMLRPSLYRAYHEILPVEQKKSEPCQPPRPADVVGPICESGDFLGKNRTLTVNEGDLMAVFGAGAYGFSMSSNYNSRRRPAEALVHEGKISLIRKRESEDDLIRHEQMVP
ncbi:MAG: diaminopimelate decarboxylase [Candidatus Omnitrophica bacterium]|nr:diaminopimelate decarboxylase [Candidatus Omnitrophota bacterium]